MTKEIWNRFQWAAWVAAAALLAASSVWASRAFTLGLGAGMGLMMLNFYVIRKVAEWFVSGETKGAVLSTAILLAKFGALLAATWVILRLPQVDSLGFGLGVVAVPLAMGFSTMFHRPKLTEV